MRRVPGAVIGVLVVVAGIAPAGPVAAQVTHPPMVVGPEIASELAVKPVTDEPVIRPPRWPGDTPYLCTASFRTSPKSMRPWNGDLDVVLFSGESDSASAEVAPGIRATLTCAIDAAGPRAGAWLTVISAAEGKVLLSSKATFALPAVKK
ncbi:MAG: hypothetical protein PHQ91_14930 [Thermoanaerobaculaceae bacterium]|nr:hypothetical protein [Thermoanaerobaculaceae bacterium]TAM48583.1 MAG: hypothetical protein EPN53_09645 [Acidobacteriota bacterium]